MLDADVERCAISGTRSRRAEAMIYNDPEQALENDFATWDEGWYWVGFTVCEHCTTWSLAQVRPCDITQLTAQALKIWGEGTALLAQSVEASRAHPAR
jgi:hypothetical protein